MKEYGVRKEEDKVGKRKGKGRSGVRHEYKKEIIVPNRINLYMS
jgi:hypothetical protein